MSSVTAQVLEEEEYHRRKGYYLDSLQRHYYFMNVGNGEVIDACRKVMPMLSSCSSISILLHLACSTCVAIHRAMIIPQRVCLDRLV